VSDVRLKRHRQIPDICFSTRGKCCDWLTGIRFIQKSTDGTVVFVTTVTFATFCSGRVRSLCEPQLWTARMRKVI
jgi:hypothetical protein